MDNCVLFGGRCNLAVPPRRRPNVTRHGISYVICSLRFVCYFFGAHFVFILDLDEIHTNNADFETKS